MLSVHSMQMTWICWAWLRGYTIRTWCSMTSRTFGVSWYGKVEKTVLGSEVDIVCMGWWLREHVMPTIGYWGQIGTGGCILSAHWDPVLDILHIHLGPAERSHHFQVTDSCTKIHSGPAREETMGSGGDHGWEDSWEVAENVWHNAGGLSTTRCGLRNPGLNTELIGSYGLLGRLPRTAKESRGSPSTAMISCANIMELWGRESGHRKDTGKILLIVVLMGSKF